MDLGIELHRWLPLFRSSLRFSVLNLLKGATGFRYAFRFSVSATAKNKTVENVTCYRGNQTGNIFYRFSGSIFNSVFLAPGSMIYVATTSHKVNSGSNVERTINCRIKTPRSVNAIFQIPILAAHLLTSIQSIIDNWNLISTG